MAGSILIAGAGIAGLTAALAFAARGFEVEVQERAARLRSAGAGIQLSPNATRILGKLDVLPSLARVAVRPPAVILRDATTMREIARVPLRAEAEKRWGSPYLVVHRADLQAALLEAADASARIRIRYNAEVQGWTDASAGVSASMVVWGQSEVVTGKLLVGADGVWSALRPAPSVFTGLIAWRRTTPITDALARDIVPNSTVNAFLGSGFHLIAYPVRAGREVNLVAFTKGPAMTRDWAERTDASALRRQFRSCASAIQTLVGPENDWLAYPVHTAPSRQAWFVPGLVLIGDAAHAMTPYAAQGAAMAIEDGYTLASALSGDDPTGDRDAAVRAWESQRRQRVDRVRRRGAFNRFAWHAAGPVAMVRDFVLARRTPEQLAGDLDWLYGYDPDRA